MILFQNNKKIDVECFKNLNLLAHAQLEEIDLGSSCGGHGICGGDKVRIESGGANLNSPTDAERKHLSSEELASGWRLACQSWPAADHISISVKCRSK